MELAGKTFGRLEVVARMEKRKNNVYWLCKCSCGKDAVVEQGNLTRGKTKSCGCLRVDKINTMLSRKRDGAFINACEDTFGRDHVFVADDREQAYPDLDPDTMINTTWIDADKTKPSRPLDVICFVKAPRKWKIKVCWYNKRQGIWIDNDLQRADVAYWIPIPRMP